MMSRRKKIAFRLTATLRQGACTAFALAAATAAPMAQAQQRPAGQPLEVDIVDGISAPLPIAIPVMPTPVDAATPAGQTAALGRQVAEIVANDLSSSGLYKTAPPTSLPQVPMEKVTAPDFGYWGGTGAQALVQGFVRAEGNGQIVVGCYVYDVFARTELAREGFVVSPAQWRRAAHKCADTVYTRLSGEGAYFDTRIVYVAESGPKNRRIKRLALMDQDGANQRFLTNGQAIALTPRFSRDNRSIVYMGLSGNQGRIFVYDTSTGQSRAVTDGAHQSQAPRFSPDGRWILFSRSTAGNTDIYRVAAGGGAAQRLTTSPAIDTGGSYSPDGSRIVFESDRSGTQQLYVMNADGSGVQRLSFGDGRYATPAWSPRGDRIAFTAIRGGRFRIGIMNPDGSGEKLLTESWGDEGPSWAPNGRVLVFFRSSEGSGQSHLWSVDMTGVNERRIPTSTDGSDPDWGPLLP